MGPSKDGGSAFVATWSPADPGGDFCDSVPETPPRHSTRPRSRRLGTRPPRIGFVVDWLEAPYQAAVLAGAVEAARSLGATLVTIPGGVLGGTEQNGTLRNQLYDLLSPRKYDGLVVMTGTLGNQLGEDVVSALCADFPKERVCSVGIALRESASVLIDNRRGMQSALEHLIRDHGHKHIAFIRGPSANMEAEERFWAYKDVLDAHRLPFDERLVVKGDFHRKSGARAIRTLLDERGIPLEQLDAIVAADDLMLLGALDELKKLDVHVPEDVALLGFDDIEEARYANPPLSSVSQPFGEQGREAVKAVLAAISGQPSSEAILLPTTDHFRRSCGCIPDDDAVVTERPPLSPALDLQAALVRQRALILAQLSRATRGAATGAGRGWETQLFIALSDELNGEIGAFRRVFSALLRRMFDAGDDLSLGHAIISGLRRELLIAAGEDAAGMRQLESLLHDARVLTCQAIERRQATRRLQAERWARVLSDVSAQLITAFDLQKLGEAISEQLPRLGINSCYVCRYSRTEHDQAELLMGFGRWGTMGGAEEPIVFNCLDLVPTALLPVEEQATLVVQPLATENERLGFVVFEYGEVEAYVYEVLRKLLTAALRGAELAAREDEFSTEPNTEAGRRSELPSDTD